MGRKELSSSPSKKDVFPNFLRDDVHVLRELGCRLRCSWKLKVDKTMGKVNVIHFIPDIYIVPLQKTYSE